MLTVCSIAAMVLGALLASAADKPTTSPTADPEPAAAAHAQYYDITRFGAVDDNKVKSTQAIQKAVDAANEAGGGTVLVPPGVYLTGTLYLRNHVTLHLSAGSTLLGSTDL